MEYKPADYTEYDKAVEQANETDRSLYKDLTVLDEALAVDVDGKNITEQDIVDEQTKAILDAMNALEKKPVPPVTEEPTKPNPTEPSVMDETTKPNTPEETTLSNIQKVDIPKTGGIAPCMLYNSIVHNIIRLYISQAEKRKEYKVKLLKHRGRLCVLTAKSKVDILVLVM